ncbi:J domain-containing protein [Sulfurospirillum oryzae]|uniref:J domain-containing protein n=1 Tax=Sulfurospirillum oryzae TaxID=2976535 RepID=UPI0021E7C691|nr:J domain-containing protein [Sulfurospirillum oryzae]
MKLHLSPDCITIYVAETSSHYLHVSHVLTHLVGRSFWVNETLINFDTPEHNQRRKAFLNSLYNTCAFASKTHNASFLQKLLLSSQKPIKLVKKKFKQRLHHIPTTHHDPYRLLNAHKTESLESIRQKYLILAKMFHPDSIVSKDESSLKNSTTKFQQIQEAYALIKAEKMRQIAA